MRRARATIAFIALVGVLAGAVWWSWLAHGKRDACVAPQSGVAAWVVAIVIVFGAVGLVERFRAWQTRSRSGSLGVDIAAFWLAVTCIVAADVLFAAAHHCFE